MSGAPLLVLGLFPPVILNQIAIIIQECQLCIFGHVVQLPPELIHQVLSCRESKWLEHWGIPHSCVRWRPIWRIWAWQAWHLPRQLPNRGCSICLTVWMWWHSAPLLRLPDLTLFYWFVQGSSWNSGAGQGYFSVPSVAPQKKSEYGSYQGPG